MRPIIRTASLRFAILPLILSLLLLNGEQVYGQLPEISPTSSKFIRAAEVDSLVLSQALRIARQKNIPPQDLESRFDNYRDAMNEALVPLLKIRFAPLDINYANTDFSPGEPGYKKAKTRYLREAADIVQTLLKGTNLFPGLFTPDPNDRILSFHSDIQVRADGELYISEFITVFNGNGVSSYNDGNNSSLNNDIQRGITRDFPTGYADKNGFWSNTGFTVKAVYKNGEAETYTTETLANGIRVRIGKKELLLQPGVYRYWIDYVTDRQLIFHADKDELYWNVNGNGWVFTADSVSCRIRFPGGALVKEHACYTGSQGSTAHNCRAQVTANGDILFSSTKRLNAYEGLTVAVSIAKGVLRPPSQADIDIAFLRSNYIIPVLSLLLLLLFGFYYCVWYYYGRDPEKGVIYPRFSPPPDLNPPDLGYIINQRYQSHLFAAALVDLAVKKQLVIEVEQKGMIFKSKVYHFRRPAGTAGVTGDTGYGFSTDTLYGQTVEPGRYNSVLKSCYDTLADSLKKRFLLRRGRPDPLYGLFSLNKGFTWIGGLTVIAGIILSLVFLVAHPSLNLLIITVSLLVALLAVHIVFLRIMSAYTKRGREIADHILGFKMYLDQAEQRVFDKLMPPEKTLELFEKYLPFAIALEVENNWAEQFDSIMQEAIEQGYQPGYYQVGGGAGRSFSMGGMSRDISSGLSRSVSSASTPPSSSGGGSGGGGSSGGGGGGGGGGGW